MSCPRLNALQEAYLNLEKATNLNYGIAERDPTSLSPQNKEDQNKKKNVTDSNFVPSQPIHGVGSSVSGKPVYQSPSQAESDEYPEIATFILQQAKKQKNQNCLPIEKWAKLHSVEYERKNNNDSLLNLTLDMNSKKVTSITPTTGYHQMKNLDNRNIEVNAKDFTRVRELVKGKLREILKENVTSTKQKH